MGRLAVTPQRRRIEATYRLTTPAFLAGARDGKKRPAELRVPSIMGALRFWWRALMWAEAAKTGGLPSLRQREARLFGAAAGTKVTIDGKSENIGRQGAVWAKLKQIALPPVSGRHRFGYPNEPRYGLPYLAGQGLLGREFIPAGTTFTLELNFNAAELSRTDTHSLQQAIWALGLMGGIGARVRRGFGSLHLVQLTDTARSSELGPQGIAEYAKCLLDVVPSLGCGDEPEYSAFWDQTQIWIHRPPSRQSAWSLHDVLGHRLQWFRSKGLDGSLGQGHAARDYLAHQVSVQHDIDLFDSFAEEGQDPGQTPKRSMFGLPYVIRSGKVSRNAKLDVAVAAPRGLRADRRGSPLFLHVIDAGEDGAYGLWTLFKAKFLPGDMPALSMSGRKTFGAGHTRCGETVKFGPKRYRHDTDWYVIEAFFDDLQSESFDELPTAKPDELYCLTPEVSAK